MQVKLEKSQTADREAIQGYFEVLQEMSKKHSSDLEALDLASKKITPTGNEVPQDFAECILQTVSEQEREKRDKILSSQLVKPLWFEELPVRQETIREAYPATLEWAFEKPEEHASQHEWDDFSEWLKTDDDLYWISGKPGAGKSTLMKYLRLDGRTFDFIAEWPYHRSSPKTLTVAGFFFWNSGSELQMSRVGFGRSMLTQLIDEATSVAELFPHRWKRCQLLGFTDEPFVWKELSAALDILLSGTDRHFLLFVDGLDEFDGEKDELANLMLELSAKPNVKICAASRPWVEFQSKFSGVPGLRMEALTKGDITTYIDGRFAQSSEFQAMQKYEPGSAKLLRDGILEKASGVFLWVYVVVSTLLRGLRDGDRMNALFAHLESLPPELDELFDKILHQLDPKHEEEASELFQFLDAVPEFSTLIGMYWSQTTVQGVLHLEVQDSADLDAATYSAEIMRRNVLSRCRCLLDVTGKTHHNSKVTWVHRTAREYLKQNDVWSRVVSQSPTYRPKLALSLSLLWQAKAKLTGYVGTLEQTLHIAAEGAQLIATIEQRNAFLDQIEDIGTKSAAANIPHHWDPAFPKFWLPPIKEFPVSAFIGPGNTTLFHVAIANDWSSYVLHRLETDRQLLNGPVSTLSVDRPLILATRSQAWDVQYLLLQAFAETNRIDIFDNVGNVTWGTFCKQIPDGDRDVGFDFPHAKALRNCVLFLKLGADKQNLMQQTSLMNKMVYLITLADGTAEQKDVDFIARKLGNAGSVARAAAQHARRKLAREHHTIKDSDDGPTFDCTPSVDDQPVRRHRWRFWRR